MKTDFYMKSKTLEVVSIISKTKAKMFEDLKVGDKIQCSIPIYSPGGNKGTYASYIKVTNIKTGESNSKSFNQLPLIISNFELKEVDE